MAGYIDNVYSNQSSPFMGGSPNRMGAGNGMSLMGGTQNIGSMQPMQPVGGLLQQYYQSPAQWRQGLLPDMTQGAGYIGGMMPGAGPYAQQSIDFANQANNASMANQAQNMAQYMPQYMAASNTAWNSTLNTPQNQAMFNARNQLLQQQQKEASGSAPSYLQDYWREQAGGQLQNTMGAFGNSQLGAGSLANMMAANLYQYHTGAENNLGNTVNNWNTYTNPAYSSVASSFNPNTTQGWNAGYGYGQTAYNNATQPYQNVGKWFVS